MKLFDFVVWEINDLIMKNPPYYKDVINASVYTGTVVT